jgi:hypothetical protein
VRCVVRRSPDKSSVCRAGGRHPGDCTNHDDALYHNNAFSSAFDNGADDAERQSLHAGPFDDDEWRADAG